MSRMVSTDTCQSQCKISREEYKILFEGGKKKVKSKQCPQSVLRRGLVKLSGSGTES